MSIKYRLILSHSTILIFMLGMLVFAGIRFNNTSIEVRKIVEGDVMRAEIAGEINIHAESVAGDLLTLFILEEQKQRTAVYKNIDLCAIFGSRRIHNNECTQFEKLIF